MIPKSCKRLAEVDFPIAEVSRHAVREKSIRHGHPSTLHLWWARRPLASSRAVLMALLLPDPGDAHCPAAFKEEARRILLAHDGRPLGWTQAVAKDEGLRRVLLKFIADFANWDVAPNPAWLATSRALVRAAHGEEPPLVVDPFAGGGSIPLEALRVGCEAFASDLNPVACLILKVMLEYIPRHGPKLAEELREAGRRIKEQAETELADLYPKDADGATPIAYLWARTVRCEAPDCGAEIPLMRSFWLCKKEKRKRALRACVVRREGQRPDVVIEVFEPANDREVRNATVHRAKATCLCCSTVLPPDRVRLQLRQQRGGADAVFNGAGRRIGGARMTAVVTLRPGGPGGQGRNYRLPTADDYAAVRAAQSRLADVLGEWKSDGRQGLCPVPDEPTPAGGGSGAGRAFSVQRYGMSQWSDLFTARQKVALMQLVSHRARGGEAVSGSLSIVTSKLADRCNALVAWSPSVECPTHYLTGNALPMAWDFSESNVVSTSSASIPQTLDNVCKNIDATLIEGGRLGTTQQADATDHSLPNEAADVFFTDPPYYDAVPYADLADFFLVWLKRALAGTSSRLLVDGKDAASLSPKDREVVEDESKKSSDGYVKDRSFFESAMRQAFGQGRRLLVADGVGSVVFAHKTTEGWEALLSGLILGGWTITGSWPIATERYSRLRARESAALATSVHLICRPRPAEAPIGDWADVLRELPKRVAEWMHRLQGEGVRGADLVFACVGPALEIYSRYRAVETVDGREVVLAEYLEKVWEVVGRSALEQVLGATDANADATLEGALEEDARLTALFLWTLQSTEAPKAKDEDGEPDEEAVRKVAAKGFGLPFDVVRRFSQPMGIDLDAWTGRIVAQAKGAVRLLPVAERAKALFGEDGAANAAEWIESDANPTRQLSLFPEGERGPPKRPRRKTILDEDAELQAVGATTLDRLHAAMLLQASGHASALRTLIAAEQERGAAFLRLANALTALYPRGSQEKRLLDAMLLAVPR